MRKRSRRPIRVLIVDASASGRLLVARALAPDGRFQVLAALRNAEEVLERIADLAPDVLTLDADLPGLTGLELLRRLETQTPTPTVLVSAPSTRGARIALEALSAGAIELVQKPAPGTTPEAMFTELRAKVVVAATAHVSQHDASDAEPPPSRMAPMGMEVIAIGASTGGPAAVERVVTSLPRNAPPVLVVLHMPSGFTQTFAQRVNDRARLRFIEAEDGTVLGEGFGYIAPGGRQLRVRRRNGALVVALGEETRVTGHCPSVDVLFQSVAETAGPRAVGALLTGMGSDGAAGLLAIREAGGRTLAQDEASCVVYGMPRTAYELGAVERLVPLDDIAARLVALPPGRRTEPPARGGGGGR